MNSNLFHNILNIVIALLGAATTFLVATGCTSLTSGALECSGSWLDPAYTGVAVAVLALVKTGVNVVRDGVAGLTKPQPPVK